MIIRSRAPLRISFGGGGTDVSPYPEENGGAVLSATIERYAYCTLSRRNDERIHVKSLDYDIVASYRSKEELAYGGQLDLVKAAMSVLGSSSGFDLYLHSDSPPGSGLGTSSAMTVAIIGAFERSLQLGLTAYDIAEISYRVEREEAGIKGGRQDQYAAAFGGFNFIEFLGKKTIVNPLRVDWDTINELHYRLLLCYTGRTRISAGIIADQMAAYARKQEEVVRSLRETKDLAFLMKKALLLGNVQELGLLLHDAWQRKKKFSAKVTDSHIDRLYELARGHGAIGGKLLGAGGGGYLLLLCDSNRRCAVAHEVEKAGGKIIDFTFDRRGLQSWQVTH